VYSAIESDKCSESRSELNKTCSAIAVIYPGEWVLTSTKEHIMRKGKNKDVGVIMTNLRLSATCVTFICPGEGLGAAPCKSRMSMPSLPAQTSSAPPTWRFEISRRCRLCTSFVTMRSTRLEPQEIPTECSRVFA